MVQTCKGCKDRVVEPNCHMTCEPYLKATREHTAAVQREREEKHGHYNVYANSQGKKGQWR